MVNASKYYRLLIKSKVLGPLSALGFKLYGKDGVCRMTDDGVFQVISFVKSTYGAGDFDIWISIRPMYCPHEDYLTSLPGNDLYGMATNNKRGKYWNYSTEAAADESFKEIVELLNKYALPFFEATKSSFGIIACYEKFFLGRRKFGNRVEWGTQGWENYDFGHIYLRAGNIKKSLRQFKKCYREFKNDTRAWAQTAAKECLGIKELVKAGHPGIEQYLEAVIRDSRQKLKLENW